jgi:hypothetical protein
MDLMPRDATHLFVSAGGNDAIGESSILSESAGTVGESLSVLHELRTRFRESYRQMLRALGQSGKPTAVCTIYDAIPDIGPAERTALALLNEVILFEAVQAGLPVVDLRLVCNQPGDFSPLSSIEPSMVGGSKIARAIAKVATEHDFSAPQSVIYR